MKHCVNALSGQTSFLRLMFGQERKYLELCQCPIGPNFISTPDLQKPFIYAVYFPYFCTYLSEYSDK